MKFFLSTLLAFGYAQQSCTVCSETMIERNKPLTITNPADLLPNKGCWDTTDAANFGTESCSKCYALFFNTRGSDNIGDDFYVLHAERGCVHERTMVGRNVTSFPSATECIPKNGVQCTMTLTEESFGNFGNIQALYAVGTAADTLSIGQALISVNNPLGFDRFNQAPLRCHQCDSQFSEANNACFQNPPPASDCEDFNATSCYSETSSYTAVDPNTNRERTYYYAKRGCSRVSSQLAGVTQIREETKELPVVPMVVENKSVTRRVKVEHCATASCNKARMDYISTSDERKMVASAIFFIFSLMI
ncbi:Oidioi.mRNA.OKI2018_I69.chr1.g3390.t1.cds [Oikopleura dioica]|uniref:Oidioi.mRNA.OKI2018_I69.chr1.g3390.t1.cds n=1 Tax=Oikopleura dioica TaxID=34765 RepID=A0ABN7STY4_OIKDI|nr:Oidioi.mRNA.OKI2018_I69.chr1.g3390.t1.cds [Oikopleura dioica]